MFQVFGSSLLVFLVFFWFYNGSGLFFEEIIGFTMVFFGFTMVFFGFEWFSFVFYWFSLVL